MSNATLYYAAGSASLVAHWLMIEIGVPHSLKKVNLQAGEQKHPDYLKLNPAGVVPTLVVEGAVLTEAASIALYLADSNPASKLLPPAGTVERARAIQWLFFCANTLQPSYRNWFYPEELLGPEHADAVKEATRLKLEKAWAEVDSHLAQNQPYLLGAERTVADFMLTMLMRWSRNMPKPADSFPHVARLAQQMKALPSFKTLYEREELTEWQ